MTEVVGRSRARSICIVGGGSAGWLTAAYALSNLPETQITLIESPNVPIVGVGEATILGFDHFLDDCNIPRELWTKSCDATIKTGTYFPNWKGDGTNIWQPFFFPVTHTEHGTLDSIDLARDGGIDEVDLEKYIAWHKVSVVDKKIPNNTTPCGGTAHVGYHLDAVKSLFSRARVLASRTLQLEFHSLGNSGKCLELFDWETQNGIHSRYRGENSFHCLKNFFE